MATTTPFALYNPSLLSPEALLAEYIARQPLLETLIDTVRENHAGESPQHVLLVGPRGMGKTTTLWAVAHSINKDAALNTIWQPVVFDEESRRVGDLADFWLEAIRQWEHATNDPKNRTQALLDKAETDIEDQARITFLQMVEDSGRRALLLIDNLNDLLASIRDPEPLHRLRARLMEESSVMLIGGATRYFAQITDVDQPFYDFFRVFELAPLKLDEMKQCLTSLAKNRGDASVEKTIAEREGTMRSLHLLTGGNPRLIKTFYRLLAEGLQGNIRTDLEHLLDEFTPYFKAIVDALPVQQQRIFDAVALNWDPVDVASVAKAIRVPSNQVSAQLRQMVKSGHIVDTATHPKRKNYLLADRFSNIHYLMRHGRAARNRFDWFIAILQLIFPDKSHANTLAKLAHHSAQTGPDGVRDARDLLQSALNRASSDSDRRILLQTTLRECWDSNSFEQFSDWFDFSTAKQHLPESDIFALCQQMPAKLRAKIGFNPDDEDWWWSLTDFLEEKSAWSMAQAAYRKIIEINPRKSGTWNDLGNLLATHLHQFEEAEAAYRKAIEINPQRSIPWNGLGNSLRNLRRLEEAETAYHESIKIDPQYAHPWNGLGNVFNDLQQSEKAEAAYRKAIEIDPHDSHQRNGLGGILRDLRRFEEAEVTYRESIRIAPQYAHPWNGLGNVLNDLKQSDKAEVAYRKAIEIDPQNPYPWNGLGSILRNFRRFEEAEAAYRESIKIDPQYAHPWNGLGNVLNDLKQSDKAEVAYRKAIEIDPHDSLPWNGLGNVLNNLKQSDKAEVAYRKAIEIDPHDSLPWNGLGNILRGLQQFEEAEAAYRESIKIDPQFAHPWNGLGNVLNDLQQSEKAESAYRKAIETDPQKVRPWAGLADLLNQGPERSAEARDAAVKALNLDSTYGFARKIFTEICNDYPDAWQAVLPKVIKQSASLPRETKLFEFVIHGCIRLAQLTSTASSLELLQSIPEATAPFETLCDALITHDDHAHLDRLAPERRVVAIELLNRISK